VDTCKHTKTISYKRVHQAVLAEQADLDGSMRNFSMIFGTRW